MKHKILLCLLLAITTCAIGCKSDQGPERTFLEDGTVCVRLEHGDMYSMNSSDTPIKYRESNFFINDIQFYESKNDSGYSLWIDVEFDMTNLSEDDFLHLKQQSYPDVYCSVNSKKNSLESADLIRYDAKYTDNQFYTVSFCMPETAYSLAGDTCSISLLFFSGEFFDYKKEDGTKIESEKLDTYFLDGISIPEILEPNDNMDASYYTELIAKIKNNSTY